MNSLKTILSPTEGSGASLEDSINTLTNYHYKVADKIRKITSPLQDKGITSFGYNKLFPDGNRIILENNLDWLHTFFDRELYKDNPDQQKVIEIIKQAPSNTIYGYLWPHRPVTLTQNVLFTQQKVWNGVSLFKKGSTCVEAYHFGTGRDNEEAPNFYLNNFDFLKRFISYFSQSSSDILDDESHYSLKGQFLPFSLAQVSQPTSDAAGNKELAHLSWGGLPLSLTKREKECLTLLAQGKRAKEIAYFLGLSVRTVECYLYTLKRKFGAHTLAELLFLSAAF